MPQLLLEIGVEELPASMVESASSQLGAAVCKTVSEAGFGGGDAQVYATPRRMIVFVDDVAERQEDRTERKRGPSEAAAFKDGQPTPALQGFARGAGVDVAEIEVEGDYVWANMSTTGKSAVDALGEPLAAAIKSISFEKTMRWGEGRTRFSRPIRWIVALLGADVIPFSIETAHSGSTSRGHRFRAPDAFEVNQESFLEDLRSRFVEPEISVRRNNILQETKSLAANAVVSDDLLDENANLTEWPVPIVGGFRDEFLALPKAVLVTAMANHERFFPIEVGGKITTGFVSVTNGGDVDTVRSGNEWVLNARLNDALFFYEEDSRKSINDFWEATGRIVFQEKLGTIKQRTERLASLSAQIAKILGVDERSAFEAGRLSKADLSTGLVSELPSLQGKVGSDYARKQGFAEEVCAAIELHYSVSENRIANAVMCADQADRLAGYMGIGEAPSGSSDPYALRKAATMLMQVDELSIPHLVEMAANEYKSQGFELSEFYDSLQELLYGRIQALHQEIPYDALTAAWKDGLIEPTRDFLARAKLVSELSSDTEFVRAAKRPGNIVTAAKKKAHLIADQVNTPLFEHDEERVLNETYEKFAPGESLKSYIEGLRALKPHIDAYFDKVMVMVEDEKVRANRLALLSKIDQLFSRIADFSKIVIEED